MIRVKYALDAVQPLDLQITNIVLSSNKFPIVILVHYADRKRHISLEGTSKVLMQNL